MSVTVACVEHYIFQLSNHATVFVFQGNEYPLCNALAAMTPDQFVSIAHKIQIGSHPAVEVFVRLCCKQGSDHVLAWFIKQDKFTIRRLINAIKPCWYPRAFTIAMENIALSRMNEFYQEWSKHRNHADEYAIIKKIIEQRSSEQEAIPASQIRQQISDAKIARLQEIRSDKPGQSSAHPIRSDEVRISLKKAVEICIGNDDAENILSLCRSNLIEVDWCLGWICGEPTASSRDLASITSYLIRHRSFDITRHHELLVYAVKTNQPSLVEYLLSLIATVTPDIDQSITGAMIASFAYAEELDILQMLVNFGHGSIIQIIDAITEETLEEDIIVITRHKQFSIDVHHKLFCHAARTQSSKLIRVLVELIK